MSALFHSFCASAAELTTALAAAALLLAAGSAAGAGTGTGVWHYTLGQQRAQQQAQFCEDETEVRALVGIFRDKGARPGYFAMKQLFDCATRIATFTPVEIIDSVAIATRTTGGYTVHFVRVRLSDGAVRFLVTTRDVALP